MKVIDLHTVDAQSSDNNTRFKQNLKNKLWESPSVVIDQ